jgi:hypothetical protein
VAVCAITVYQSDRHRSPGHLSRQGPPALRWALYEAAQRARFPSSPDRDYACRRPSGSGATAPAWHSRASCSSAAITRCESSVTTRSRHPQRRRATSRVAKPLAARQAAVVSRDGASSNPRVLRMLWPLDPGFGSAVRHPAPASGPAYRTTTFQPFARVKPSLTPMRRGRLPNCCCRHARVDGLERSSGRNASPSGITPSNILSPAREPTHGSCTEVSLGARAHTHSLQRAHAPPAHHRAALDTGRRDK